MIMKSWLQTENLILEIAAMKWNCPAGKEIIAGNSIDAVLKPEQGYYILIEITEDATLKKARNDITKLNIARNYLFTNNIFAKCYIIINGNITESMRGAATECKIEIMSVDEFYDNYLGCRQYVAMRKDKSFGSCIDIETGETERNEYIPVKYIEYDIDENFTLSEKRNIFLPDILDSIRKGKKIVLLGEYGTGKSRCLKELFFCIRSEFSFSEMFPVSVNLRECGGLKRSSEILRRHYEDLGLSDKADGLIKMWTHKNFTFLLDGFDEIAAQGWSENKETIKNIRFQSLSGVREVIQAAHGGVLICGREHYFSSHQEMLQLLGIKKHQAIIIRCKEQFEDEEFDDFLNSTGNISVPKWMPRRPLICNITAKFSDDEKRILLNEDSGEVAFWNKFLDLICLREERMFQTFVAETTKKILVRISRFTRSKNNEVGPITPNEIRKAFEDILGSYPIEQASVLLQRLVGLGRYEAESENRKFADLYILDGLRALDVLEIIKNCECDVFLDKWNNPVKKIGIAIIADKVTELGLDKLVDLVRKQSKNRNNILLSDICSGILSANCNMDFKDICISDAHISTLNLSSSTPQNITFSQTIIDEVIAGAISSNNFKIENCIIGKILGIPNPQRLPGWIFKCQIGQFLGVQTTSAIKNASLSDNHKVLLTVIHKIFFQPGAARKEEALLRGLGAGARGADHMKIINLLIREGVISKAKGETGTIYKANRKLTDRMRRLEESKQAANDPLWDAVADI